MVYQGFLICICGDEMNCIDLDSLVNKPKINDLTYDLIREFYETRLYPYEYEYIIHDTCYKYEIKLRFDKDCLSHLLGLEKIVKYSVNRNELYKYRGLNAWYNIENGYITIDKLKRLNKKGFNSQKDNLVFFYLIPRLVSDSPKAIYLDKSIVNPTTFVDCKLMFYDKVQNAMIHLGLEPKDDNTYYRPRTFLIERITSKNDGSKFIKNQTVISASIKSKVAIR